MPPRGAHQPMKTGTAQKISNAILSCAAGIASFIFSLMALLYLTELDEKILAALVAGAFCLLVSYVASERPNSESARALVGARRPACWRWRTATSFRRRRPSFTGSCPSSPPP